eukprot:13694028-Alexandrium_andersonii.AAC.1
MHHVSRRCPIGRGRPCVTVTHLWSFLGCAPQELRPLPAYAAYTWDPVPWARGVLTQRHTMHYAASR